MCYIYVRDVLLKKAPRVLQRRGLFYTAAESLPNHCRTTAETVFLHFDSPACRRGFPCYAYNKRHIYSYGVKLCGGNSAPITRLCFAWIFRFVLYILFYSEKTVKKRIWHPAREL